jgi:glycosyltransferase involved in cell wall biosynthesis
MSSAVSPPAVREQRVSVVIPARDEAANLPAVLAEIPKDIFEIVLVDGASTDGTVDVARSCRPDVRVIHQSGRGKGDAMLRGFAAARGDIIVMLDGDGSARADEIPRFVKALAEGADLAKGSRFLGGGGSADITPLRRLGNRFLRGTVNLLFKTSYTDLCYGYNAIWSRCLPQLCLDCTGFEFESLLNIRAARARLDVREVPSYEERRLNGMSNLHPFRDGFRILRLILRERFAQAGSSRADRRTQEFEPIRLLEAEVGGPEPRLLRVDGNGQPYRSTRVLVRLHGAPLGVVDIDRPDSEIDPDIVGEYVHRELKAVIDAHLREDAIEHASPNGNGTPAARTTPRCIRRRLELKERAPSASIVIGTRERPDSLAATLDSVLALEYQQFEVIVVDNAHTTDRTRDLLATRYSDVAAVRYVREPLPGLAVAHNRGLSEARGEIVAFTDDDVFVDRRWLLELARGFELGDRVACVTGLILPTELETPAQLWLDRWVRLNKGYEPKLFDMGAHRPPGKLFPYAAGTLGSGANMAFRTDALRSVGGFDPATGTGSRARGGDDLAGFFSILSAGLTLAYQPTAIVRHAHRREAESLRTLMFDYGAGLGAFLTKIVVDRPELLLDIAWRVPFGAAHAVRSRPSRRDGSLTPLGKGLVARERLGMLAGAVGYLVERRARRAFYATDGCWQG